MGKVQLVERKWKIDDKHVVEITKEDGSVTSKGPGEAIGLGILEKSTIRDGNWI